MTIIRASESTIYQIVCSTKTEKKGSDAHIHIQKQQTANEIECIESDRWTIGGSKIGRNESTDEVEDEQDEKIWE